MLVVLGGPLGGLRGVVAAGRAETARRIAEHLGRRTEGRGV